MNSNHKQHRKPPPSILDRIYDQSLREFNLPFSHSNLKRIHNLSNLHSNIFQNIVFYTHNNFEICALGDAFNAEESKRFPEHIAGLDPGRIEQMFLLTVAVYQAAQSLGMNFIDFSTFRLFPDHSIQFPVFMDEEKEFQLKNLLEIFTRNKHFKELNEKNFREIFERLKNKTFFNESQVYIYKYDDFASNILNTYPIAGQETGSRIKIAINTIAPIQDKIIKINFYNNHFSEDIFFADLDNPSDNLPHSIARLITLSGKSEIPGEDFVSLINRFNLFLKKSSFSSLVLMINRLRTNQDVEFLSYLLEALEIHSILLICFDTDCNLIEFDLELNEKPVNLLRKYLRFGDTNQKKTYRPGEIQLLKVFHTLPVPISREQAATLFNPDQSAIIGNLIDKNMLKVTDGKIHSVSNTVHPGLTITTAEQKGILESILDKNVIESLAVKVKYFIITRQVEELKTVLRNFLAKKQSTGDMEFCFIKTILEENSLFFETNNDIGLMELLAVLLVEANELDSARQLIFNHIDINKSTILKLQLAHIYKWEKENQKMGQLLKEIEDEAKPKRKRNIFHLEDLNDQFYYLRFVYFEKISDIKRADRYLKKIKGERCTHRAAVLLSDRYIYQGNYKETEIRLHEAIEYFRHKKYCADEIEAKSHLAKLSRKKQAFADAEKLYQNLFIKCEMKNYHLLSAYNSIDLGNVYWVLDKFNQASVWYKKALKIFQTQSNQNGIILAKSNLMLINKVKGNWQETKNDLEAILSYDKQKNAAISMAIDHFNIAHLEYLKHNFTRAREFIDTAWDLFKKNSNWHGMIECEVLRLKISLLVNSKNKNHLDFLLKHQERLTDDQKILVSIIEIFKIDRNNRRSNQIIKQLNHINSKRLRFEIISNIAIKYRTPELLDALKSLSASLSRGDKNYYYYEYFYIYYGYYYNKGEIDDHEKERFNEVYYFFHGNRRRMAAAIFKYKHILEEKESQYDVFRSAQLVGDYIHWKKPGDFFDSLVNELRKIIPVDLVRLVIYEGKYRTNDPLFDFSRILARTRTAGANHFNAVTDEIISHAVNSLENLNLSPPEIKECCKSKEKAFYFYKNTKVILWKIGGNLFGVLLLTFSKEEFYDYDFYKRHEDLLKKFASLINRYYQGDFKLNPQLDFIIGESQAVKQLKETILKVSNVDFSVLIRGESGSGKELVAKAVHLLSGRAGDSFITVNAAAIPENLLEAELFGYKKGAFTGASENKTGLIEAAHNGTLFLDEIADLPLNLQAKLLRVLQEKEIRRLGENTTRKVNIRLITATNKDLKYLIEINQFREDLYFRFQELTIYVPPLRKRLEDIPLLVRHFLKKYGFKITDKEELRRIIEFFKDRTWTGNIRELESNVKRLITYYPDFETEQGMSLEGYTDIGLIEARDNLEKRMLTQALKENNWNKVYAANVLKISRQYLFKLMKKHGIKLEG